jgi:L-aspartate oxidase
MMGGIATDLEGRASLPGLYAVGECSCTGLHGANRLASNSLTECFVFGARAARAALQEPEPAAATLADIGANGMLPEAPPAASASSRRALWEHAGLERDRDGLQALSEDSHPLVRLIAACALARTESRGAHQRSDFPHRDPALDGRHVTARSEAGLHFEQWE